MQRPETIEQDGVRWMKLAAAARFTRIEASDRRADVEARAIPSMSQDGRTYIRSADAYRLKREAAAMRAVRRGNARPPVPIARAGPHAARERQNVLDWAPAVTGKPLRRDG